MFQNLVLYVNLSLAMAALKAGDQVVRATGGKFAQYGDQYDGGEGGLGTVVSAVINYYGSLDVTVVWHHSGRQTAFSTDSMSYVQLAALKQDPAIAIVESNLAIFEEEKYADFCVVVSCGDVEQTMKNKMKEDVKTCKKLQSELRIPCHKAFLSIESPYFAGLFESGMNEVNLAEVKILNHDMDVVKSFVKFFYTKEVDSQVT